MGDFVRGCRWAVMGQMSDDLPDLEPIDLEPIALEPIAPPTWPAGWYADPWTAGQYRYWNGEAWTSDTTGRVPTDAGDARVRRRPPAGRRRRTRRRGAGAVRGWRRSSPVSSRWCCWREPSATQSRRAPRTTRRAPTRAPTTLPPGPTVPAAGAADRAALSKLVVQQSDVGSARRGGAHSQREPDNRADPRSLQRHVHDREAPSGALAGRGGRPTRRRAAQHRSGHLPERRRDASRRSRSCARSAPRVRTQPVTSPVGERDGRDGVQGPRPTAPGRGRRRSSGWRTASPRRRVARRARRSRCTSGEDACSWVCTSPSPNGVAAGGRGQDLGRGHRRPFRSANGATAREGRGGSA